MWRENLLLQDNFIIPCNSSLACTFAGKPSLSGVPQDTKEHKTWSPWRLGPRTKAANATIKQWRLKYSAQCQLTRGGAPSRCNHRVLCMNFRYTAVTKCSITNGAIMSFPMVLHQICIKNWCLKWVSMLTYGLAASLKTGQQGSYLKIPHSRSRQ